MAAAASAEGGAAARNTLACMPFGEHTPVPRSDPSEEGNGRAGTRIRELCAGVDSANSCPGWLNPKSSPAARDRPGGSTSSPAADLSVSRSAQPCELLSSDLNFLF